MSLSAAGCGGSEQESESASGTQGESGGGPRRPAVSSGEHVQRQEQELNTARANVNEPPKARLEVIPEEGWAGLTAVHFDAGLSSDDYSLSGQLQKRFDFDGDGTWDTRFQRSSRVGHTFERPGRYAPRLEVRDTGGRSDSVTAPPITIHPACPPPDFTLVDVNPNSPTRGRSFRLADTRGRPVLAWIVTVST